ncbi:MAG TPA: 2-amino-4-hydroxy-6-hydroxymethyldihydropteridine diphosphokinase [Xanthomonadales bacterium]|nr:2-amino-4-hydroxy-6-hydroxymethyldihydropteridine diphosphokinase [Xanthomonadales bacterium]
MGENTQRVFIGLGSNLSGPLGAPGNYIELALARLSLTEGLSSMRRSRMYRSAPWGNSNQGDFLNGVVTAQCSVSPELLLDQLQALENDLGRIRAEKWGPRVIDLDLLCFGDVQMNSEKLVIPHPHMHERSFVLVPLLELDPEFEIPGIGPARLCLAKLPEEQVVRPA